MVKGICFRGGIESCLYTPSKLVWGFCFWIDFKQSKLFPRAISFDKLTFRDKVRISLEIPSRISNKHDADVPQTQSLGPIPPSHGGNKFNNQIKILSSPVRSRVPNLSLFSQCCNRPGRQHLFPFIKNQLTHHFSSRQHSELEVTKRSQEIEKK